ncbi:hypothetical protein [Novosphingobium sp. 28-62-57]|uniref:hypothetical protein n=1 Tax=Novosphingobium sp. 28-62-57 TaxID=1970409 RepID=UPI0025DEF8E5|nr:hypothetical protein [Novosphingobium sp. 28-62-57]
MFNSASGEVLFCSLAECWIARVWRGRSGLDATRGPMTSCRLPQTATLWPKRLKQCSRALAEIGFGEDRSIAVSEEAQPARRKTAKAEAKARGQPSGASPVEADKVVEAASAPHDFNWIGANPDAAPRWCSLFCLLPVIGCALQHDCSC